MVVMLVVIAAAVAGTMLMGRLILFSELHGKILYNGQPVNGARVLREWDWGNASNAGSDTATTDAAGKFHLPAITSMNFLMKMLPLEPVISQWMWVEHNGQKTQIWKHAKHNYRMGGEFDIFNEREPTILYVECELTGSFQSADAASGLCRQIDAEEYRK